MEERSHRANWEAGGARPTKNPNGGNQMENMEMSVRGKVQGWETQPDNNFGTGTMDREGNMGARDQKDK